MSGVSKQTLNSAVRALEKDGILYLEPYKGVAKLAVLTERGAKPTPSRPVARLSRAELRAFDGWTEEEVCTHIRLLENIPSASAGSGKAIICGRGPLDAGEP